MQDSITMAEVGSMVKVNGSRIATPFGPPRPGSTPTKMPSTSPTIISAIVFHVSRTAKPCSKRPRASILVSLASEGRFERPLRHDDVEGDVEGDEHDRGEEECCEQRFPQRDLTDHPHEGRDQEEACDVEPEKLRGEAEQQCRNEHLHDPAQLRARDEGFRSFAAGQNSSSKPVEAGAGKDHRQIKRKIARLRAG